MVNNNAFFKFTLLILLCGFINLVGCAETQVKDTEPPKPEPQQAVQSSNDEHVERALKKLRPHLSFVDDKALDETIGGYRKIYFSFLNRNTEQPLNERLATLEDMVTETIQSLESKNKDTKAKRCVVERDFIAAEVMPILGDVEGMYKRHLNKAPLSGTELTALNAKLETLNKIDSRIQKLCKPYKDTLRLLSNEAKLDAGYILNGGSSPGKAIPDQDSEVDELLNDSNAFEK